MSEALKRKALLRELYNYKSFNAEEEVNRAKHVLLFQKNASPFSRDSHPHHFTVSALVVDETYSYVLLIKHKKLGIWLQPGGHCEGEPSMREGALREVMEETGLKNISISKDIFDVAVYPYDKDNSNSHTDYDVMYLAVADKNQSLMLQEEEIADIRWVPLEDLLDYNHKKPFARGIEKVKKLREARLEQSQTQKRKRRWFHFKKPS